MQFLGPYEAPQENACVPRAHADKRCMGKMSCKGKIVYLMLQDQDWASSASPSWGELASKNKHPRSLLCIQKYSLASCDEQSAHKSVTVRLPEVAFAWSPVLSCFYSDIPKLGTSKQEPDELIERVQEELKPHKHLNNKNIREAFLQCDKDGSGVLDKAKFLSLCDSLSVPTNTILLNQVRRKGCCACWIPLL